MFAQKSRIAQLLADPDRALQALGGVFQSRLALRSSKNTSSSVNTVGPSTWKWMSAVGRGLPAALTMWRWPMFSTSPNR